MFDEQAAPANSPQVIRYLTPEHIEILHEAVLEPHDDPTILDVNLVRSVAVRPQTSYFGEEQFPGLLLKAAVMLQAWLGLSCSSRETSGRLGKLLAFSSAGADGTSSMASSGRNRNAIVCRRLRRRVSAWALPRPSATAPAKLGNNTGAHSHNRIRPTNKLRLPINPTLVIMLPQST